jgi:hypothetical protein
MLQLASGGFKSWGMNWKRQQGGMYQASDNWRPGGDTTTSFIGDGRGVRGLHFPDEVAHLSVADFGEDSDGKQMYAKMWSAMGPYYSVAVFHDNTIRKWGNTDVQSAFTNMEAYTPTGGSTTKSVVNLMDKESIVELRTSWDFFVVRTDMNNIFHSGDLSVPVDLGTAKTVKQMATTPWGWYVLFEDGSMKSIGGKYLGLHGYSELGDESTQFVGYDVSTVRNAPFVDFGQPIKLIKSYASNAMHAFSVSDEGPATNMNGLRGAPQLLPNGYFPPETELGSANAAGTPHMCAIMTDDSLKCWGSNWAGQLGYEDYKNRGYTYPISENTPLSTQTLRNVPSVDVGRGRTVRDMCVGMASTCVVLDNYRVKCWGTNEAGNLGQSDRIRRGHKPGTMGDNLPYIDLGYNVKAVQVECYQNSVCAVTLDGKMKCWGRNCGDEGGNNGKGSVLPYNSRGNMNASGSQNDAESCKDKGADWTTMGEYLPFVNVDCENKASRPSAEWSESTDKTCSGVGLSITPKEPPSVCGSSRIKSIKTTINIAMTQAEFTPQLRQNFISSVAYMAGVTENQVLITSIIQKSESTTRRLLATSIDLLW